MKYHICHVNVLLLNLPCLNSTLFGNFSTPCFSVTVLKGLNIRYMDDFQKGNFVTVGISDRLPPHTEAYTLYVTHARIKRGKSRLRITTGTQNMFLLFSFSNI
jgi:hypothetical protein